MKNMATLAACLLLIAACNTPPKVVSFTPAGVMIDYSKSSIHEATMMAQQFCSSMNKDAQYVRTEGEGRVGGVAGIIPIVAAANYAGSTRVAFFNCVENNKNTQIPPAGSGQMPIINNFK